MTSGLESNQNITRLYTLRQVIKMIKEVSDSLPFHASILMSKTKERLSVIISSYDLSSYKILVETCPNLGNAIHAQIWSNI